MATLVAYGMPQKNIALRSASGAPLHKTLHFDSKNFTGKVRDNFEKALGVALQRFIGSEVPDVSQAKYLFTPDIKTLSMVVASRRYNLVTRSPTGSRSRPCRDHHSADRARAERIRRHSHRHSGVR